MKTLMGTAVALAAAGVALRGCRYAAMWPESQIFGATILGENDPDEIALTFDDGPNETCTERLLEILARHNVRATFFMIGIYARQRRDLVRAVHAAGHLIGNHTATHLNLLYCTRHTVTEELTRCNEILEDSLGQRVRYFRPPFGARRPDVLRAAREMALIPVMWNALGEDWKDLTPERMAATVEAGIQRNRQRGMGSNVLMHDGSYRAMGADRSRTLQAVELLLARLAANSRLVTVDAFLRNDP